MSEWLLFSLCALTLALILDNLLGELRCWHPLVGFGNWAIYLERRLNKLPRSRGYGVIAWSLAVLPIVFATWWLNCLLNVNIALAVFFNAVVLYLAIGWQSLIQHAVAIAQPLIHGDIAAARRAVSMIVSRDTGALNEQQVAGAATESVLENGADAIFAAIFWFLLLGAPGVVLYRLANTLDAMWGYKKERYRQFGWAAARIDDLLNFIPARLVAASYTLLGRKQLALRCWRAQGFNWKSPNAGPVMASGAGALNIKLGGEAPYHGRMQSRPLLGPENGDMPSGAGVMAACALVNRTLLLWWALLAATSVVSVLACL